MDLQRLLTDSGIVRNRIKIESAIRNAREVLRTRETFGSFDSFMWRYVNHAPKQNAWNSMAEVPALTGLSDMMSKDLRQRGYGFVGSTICYAFVQAVGMVNDHVVACFRHEAVRKMAQRHKCSVRGQPHR